MKMNPINKPQKEPIFAVADIETMNWTKFIMLGFYDGKAFREFRTLKAFLFFLETSNVPETIFFHFGGKFDILFILKELMFHKKYKVNVIVPRGSSLLYVEATIGARTYVFRDSSALLPFSLKSITENFGVENKKGDWDHSKTKGYSKELAEYCKDDCIGLYQSLEKFYTWPLVKKAGPANTMASQAMRVFRTYLKEPLWGLCDYGADFSRRSYFGGRTEIFRPFCNKGPLYEYDVNSLYPFVMRDNYFPIGNGQLVFDFKPSLLGIYHANVEAPSHCDIPCLGIVHDSKYIFPIGKFEGYWTDRKSVV